MTTYYCDLVPRIFTILPSKAPVEASFHDGVAIVPCRPVVQKLFTRSTLLSVLIADVLLLHFIGATEMNVLHALDLSRKTTAPRKEWAAKFALNMLNICVLVSRQRNVFPSESCPPSLQSWRPFVWRPPSLSGTLERKTTVQTSSDLHHHPCCPSTEGGWSLKEVKCQILRLKVFFFSKTKCVILQNAVLHVDIFFPFYYFIISKLLI